MSSVTVDGWWIYLDSIDTEVSPPEPHTHKAGGVTRAELLAMALEAVPDLERMAEDGTDEEHRVREIVMSQELDIRFELYRGRLRAFLTWRDFVRVHLIGWSIVDMNGGSSPFEIDSQFLALSSLLKPYPSVEVPDAAEEDFFTHMWARRHEAWIRLVLNAVRFTWADRVTIRDEAPVADMV